MRTRFITDLHIHSHYSRATSKNLTPEHLDYWARLKGIQVMGTGDCQHPGWLKELKEKLEPAGNGFFRLKQQYRLPAPELEGSRLAGRDVFFVLTTEISNIYKKNGKVRKLHHVLVFPDFATVDWMQARLERIGNIRSDGRPILGMDSKDLLALTLESGPKSIFIPAHIWTPWFSVLGSKSGFDSVEECFEELTSHIFAVETGLSSDPPMNRICSFLDRFQLVSNSDAHSPEKLGREANLFDTELSYDGMHEALRTGNGFLGTVEFFPQEGKYHYDGHRACKVFWNPLETIEHGGVCPVCGKEVTKGVMYRVAELADRQEADIPARPQEFRSITPLPELIGEIVGTKSTSKKARQDYFDSLRKLGPEFEVLLFTELDEIKAETSDVLAEGIRRLRAGHVDVTEGFDGVYGQIRVFKKGETKLFSGPRLFSADTFSTSASHKGSVEFDVNRFQALRRSLEKTPHTPAESKAKAPAFPAARTGAQEQQQAVAFNRGVCMVLAGPGAGKTTILTERIRRLVAESIALPEQILAITFSNKAAEEMRQRLEKLDSEDSWAEKVTVRTFHALGLSIIKAHYAAFGLTSSFRIIDTEEQTAILEQMPGLPARSISSCLKQIERKKQGIKSESESDKDISPDVFDFYQTELRKRDCVDLSDLIDLPVTLLKENNDIGQQYRQRYHWLLVDEYQDINARQYEFIRLLAGPAGAANLFAIGDPDQAIYGFRGSDVRFIDQLQQDYPETATIRLPRSYRCPDAVLKIAGKALGKREFMTGKADTVQAVVHESPTEKSEADFIAAEIDRMIGGVQSMSMNSRLSDGTAYEGITSFSDIAILCRSAVMFEPVVAALQQYGIPFQVIESEPFYRKEPLRGLIALVQAVYYNTSRDMSSELSLRAQRSNASNEGASVALHGLRPAGQPRPNATFSCVGLSVPSLCSSPSNWQSQFEPPPHALSALGPFGQGPTEEILNFSGESSSEQVDPLRHQIAETIAAQQPVAAILKTAGQHAGLPEEVLKPLLALSQQYGARYDDFFRDILLRQGVDDLDIRREAVSVMTIHAAKGLEFEAVFMPGCENGILPFELFGKKTAEELKEEERLFYVGVTRTKKYLTLTYTAKRFWKGRVLEGGKSPILARFETDLYRFSKRAVDPEKQTSQMVLF